MCVYVYTHIYMHARVVAHMWRLEDSFVKSVLSLLDLFTVQELNSGRHCIVGRQASSLAGPYHQLLFSFVLSFPN